MALALAVALCGCTPATPLPGADPTGSLSSPAGSSAGSAATASSHAAASTGDQRSGPSATGPTDPPTSSARPSSRPPSAARGADWQSGPRVEGIDVSPYQPSVNWAAVAGAGLRFVWIKASEGTTWRSATYARQREGARAAGLLQGAYHYARPAGSAGSVQARHFVASGGGWSADGATLPGALDLEAAERGDPCHGRTPAQLSAWIREFSDTYRRLTTRAPVVYVRADLWARCLAGDPSFGSTNPLWLFDHDGDLGPWPSGWERPTVWQRGVVPVAGQPMDRNVWFGTEAELRDFAARG